MNASFIFVLFAAGVWLIARGKRNEEQEQIGRIKRRIYKEVSLAQQAGVDFSKKFGELTEDEIVVLESVGTDAGWKQSKRSIEAGKTYAESYYGSLRRAWNAVSGVRGVGKAYNVKDADGYVVLTWIEDAAEHVAHERAMLEQEKELRRMRRRRQREGWTKADMLPPVAPPVAPEPEPIPEPIVEERIEEPGEPIAPPTPKKERKAKVSKSAAKEAERAERAAFAEEFLNEKAEEYDIINIANGWDGKTYGEMIQDAFVDGTLKVKEDKGGGCSIYLKRYKDVDDEYMRNGWYYSYIVPRGFFEVPSELLTTWEERRLKKSFEREDLNDIRRALLDKAKHMAIVIENDDETEIIRGDDRYDYLNSINWILMVKVISRNSAAETVDETMYPQFACPTKEIAERYLQKRSQGGHGSNSYTYNYRVIPVTDVDIDAISGLPIECD